MARMINTLNFIENLRLRSFGLFRSRSARRQSQFKIAALAVAVLLVSAAGTEPAYAQNLEGLATRMLGLLSNGLMRSLATIAVIVTGAAWWTGRLDGAKAFTVAFGIIIVFTAPFIVNTISGGA